MVIFIKIFRKSKNIFIIYIMQKQPVRKLFVSERLRNFAYNIKYKAIGYLEEYSKLGLLAPYQRAYILGTIFQADEATVQLTNEQIYQAFHKIIWITYRSGFPQLPHEMDSSYVTDTGWGCMIRVGQMLFAQIIKTHRRAVNEVEIEEILKQFSDFDRKAVFSIQNIAKIARLQYGLKPGEWYNPSQISFILSELFEKKKPKGCNNLDFKVFNSGNLFFDQLVQIMAKKDKECSCKVEPSDLICLNCNSTAASLAIIVLSRLGLDSPEPKYLNILNLLMECQYFQGVIGGKPSKALYFVGTHQNQYIYLDPHYVQDAKQEMQQVSDSYFCDSFRKCKNTSIDPSLGICFYVRDLKELNNLYIFLNTVKQQNLQDFFIFMARETPNYAKQKVVKRQYLQQEEDYFEEL